MKLSATFNFFDGGELLLRSVQSIRPHVDHLSIVFQTTSNFGQPQSEASAAALLELSRSGIVDDFDLYEPDPAVGGSQNEFRKRHRGIELAQDAGCDAFVFLDADEFFDGPSFDAARAAFEASTWAASSVHYYNYYRIPTLRIAKTMGIMPFICRVSESHDFDAAYPYRVNPTRAVASSFRTHHLFPAGEIVMHHMTGVRNDVEEKLRNSSQNDDDASIQGLRALYAAVPHVQAGPVLAPDGESYVLEEVPDRFDLADRIRS